MYGQVSTLGSIFSPISGMNGHILMKHLLVTLPRFQGDIIKVMVERSRSETFQKITFQQRHRWTVCCWDHLVLILILKHDRRYSYYYPTAWMQTRSSNENAVCLSVCPSVKRVDCDKTEEQSLRFLYNTKESYSIVFWEKDWLVGVTPSTWNLGSTGPHWSKIPILNR